MWQLRCWAVWWVVSHKAEALLTNHAWVCSVLPVRAEDLLGSQDRLDCLAAWCGAQTHRCRSCTAQSCTTSGMLLLQHKVAISHKEMLEWAWCCLGCLSCTVAAT